MADLSTFTVGIVYTFQAEDIEHAVEQFIDTIGGGGEVDVSEIIPHINYFRP